MLLIIKLLISIVVATEIAVTAATSPQLPHAVAPNQEGLAHLFLTSRITAQDPHKSMSCFADYILHSNAISGAYGEQYNECLIMATASREQVMQNVITQRISIVNVANDVCNNMRHCNENNNTLELFNCHAREGANNTKATYTISGNASEYATLLQESYRIIDLHQNQCERAAERNYVEETASNYNYLQACLDGRVLPRPAPTTTTTTTTTTSTTTTTTTEAPLTAEPDTTEDPIKLQEEFDKLLNMLN